LAGFHAVPIDVCYNIHMPALLMIVGVALIEWLLLAAEISGNAWYYLYGFIVLILWTEAFNKRRPKLYPNRTFRIAFFSVYYFMFLLMNKSYFFVLENGLTLPAPQVPPTGWLPAVNHWLSAFF
jgi:hypothetical protein